MKIPQEALSDRLLSNDLLFSPYSPRFRVDDVILLTFSVKLYDNFDKAVPENGVKFLMEILDLKA